MRPRSLLLPALAAVLLAVGCAGREAQKVAELAPRPVVRAQAARKESAPPAPDGPPWRGNPGFLHDFNEIAGVAISRGGTLVAVADHTHGSFGCFGYSDYRVAVHESATGQEIASLRGQHELWLDAMAFTPSGETLAILAHGETWFGHPRAEIALLDPRTGDDHTFEVEPPGPAGNLRLSVADSAVALGVFPEGNVHVWRVPSGEPLTTIRDPSAIAMALSEDGSTLALVTKDSRIRLQRLPEGRVVSDLASPSEAPRSLRFQGDRLIYEAKDGEVWAVPVSGAAPPQLGKVRPDATFVGVNANGQVVDVLQQKGVATVTEGPHVHTLSWHGTAPVPFDIGMRRDQDHADAVAALSPEGDRVVAAWGSHVHVRRTGDAAEETKFGQHLRGTPLGAGPLADGAVLLGAVWNDGTARIWNVRTGQPVVPENGPMPRLSSLAIHEKGAVATVDQGGAAILWDRQGTTLKRRHALRTNGPATVVTFDGPGDRILVGTRRGELVIAESSSGTTRRVVRTGGKAVSSIQMLDEKTAWVRVAWDRGWDRMLIVDLETGKQKPDEEEGTIGLLGGDPNAPTEPWGPPRFGVACWDSECHLLQENGPDAVEPRVILASFGVLDRPGTAFVRAHGQVDTLGTPSAELFVCRNGGRTYPFSHCRDLVETPGLLGRTLDAACAQGAAFCPR
ncbi:WD40 repeat domain-containing protein [Polyangium sp. y55x31]|uniref:WD40 repeat domain-containing protein n=1 Tax=Polyangium sp. y55x31 TaxID=3042688 RepID=UPI002482563B|nr:WD40 repeat domain-containing protein [Polyangium sp. y55x31]MDI1479556.1 WD40 repeat domain-containing protein [Polyangium sp. y55x31]